MKIINILGGLGNQMFQYAFAIAMQAEFQDEQIKLCTQCFRGYPLHNGFELNRIFRIDLPYASLKDLFAVAWPWGHYRLWQVGRRFLPRRSTMAWDTDFEHDFDYQLIRSKQYFDGYWQSPRFFEKHRESVIKAMRFPEITDDRNHLAIDFIAQGKTAFIHVRRGDYLNHPGFSGICTIEYYTKGIKILKTSYGFNRFLIFSNDINWCKEMLSPSLKGCDVMFVDWNCKDNSYRDMQLMTHCHGALIANSSFSWWGAWLSDADVILCPHRWSNRQGHREDIFPSNWIKI